MTSFTLRPYQRASLDALYVYWAQGRGNALIVLPTGAGKSLVLAALCQEILRDYPTLRIAIVTHVRELISQNFIELLRLWPAAPAGIYSAGIGRRDARSKILFCGIQSVWKRTREIGAIDLLLVDEAHLIPRAETTTYRKFIERLRELTPDMRIVGLTATAFRLDSGRLDRGDDKVFDDIVYEANVRDLIKQGYLSPLISKATAQQLDVTGVGKRGGEYIPGQLEAAVDTDAICQAAAQEMARFGAERKAWLAFCAGINHAQHMRDAIRATGFTCETVTGETPKAERDRIINAFRNGQICCLTSVGVLGTGFNVPAVDLIALLRPTQSAGLFLQQVGRGLRKAQGKSDCLVLDFAGNTRRHGPIDTITAASADKAKGDGEAKVMAKECPECHSLVHLCVMLCPDCGHEWMRDEKPKHEAVADATTSILSTGQPQWLAVDAVRYYRHEKPGSPPSLRAEYWCGMVTHRQWLCFEHQGFARQKAENWWLRAAGNLIAIPATVDEALARVNELRTPTEIQVRPNGRFFDIVGRRFAKAEAAA
jgi:DNA repair protein RadD